MILDCTPRQRTRRRRARLRRERRFLSRTRPRAASLAALRQFTFCRDKKRSRSLRACGREIFLGCTGLCKKYWRKSAQVSGLSFFRRAAAGKGKFRSPRGGADYWYLPPDRCAGHQNTKSGLGRFFHICAYILYVCGGDNGVFCGFMSSCNRSGGLLQVCYRWGESVDLKFCLW